MWSGPKPVHPWLEWSEQSIKTSPHFYIYGLIEANLFIPHTIYILFALTLFMYFKIRVYFYVYLGHVFTSK